jgi:hypothetical protein
LGGVRQAHQPNRSSPRNPQAAQPPSRSLARRGRFLLTEARRLTQREREISLLLSGPIAGKLLSWTRHRRDESGTVGPASGRKCRKWQDETQKGRCGCIEMIQTGACRRSGSDSVGLPESDRHVGSHLERGTKTSPLPFFRDNQDQQAADASDRSPVFDTALERDGVQHVVESANGLNAHRVRSKY